MPLTIGIGGLKDAGILFVGELVEVLESRNLLVAGLDLTELLGGMPGRRIISNTGVRNGFMIGPSSMF